MTVDVMGDAPATPVVRAPAWLIVATGLLALTVLALAVAETDLKAQYLIDQGEFISVFGLAFILGAGLYLHKQRRLVASLPLVFPWLLYPIITQGDQIIDNLSINAMRVIVHVLLAAIFATPVAVIVAGARYMAARVTGRALSRRAASGLAVVLLAAEIGLADAFLGVLMIVTQLVMIAGVLLYAIAAGRAGADANPAARRVRGERLALVILVAGVAISFGAYIGYKNQPGAYQGSPSFFMDPAMKDAAYRLDRVAIPPTLPRMPPSPEPMREALTAYGRTLERLLAGYHLLDRNYTYDFHNALFVRHRPLVPNYREAGLRIIDEARTLRAGADDKARRARALLSDDDPLAAFADDVRAYVAFVFDRAALVERMSGRFERTQAGLQHAAHLYEGEGKYLGTGLSQLLNKHRGVAGAPALAPVVGEFAATGRSIHDAYAHHIVGF